MFVDGAGDISDIYGFDRFGGIPNVFITLIALSLTECTCHSQTGDDDGGGDFAFLADCFGSRAHRVLFRDRESLCIGPSNDAHIAARYYDPRQLIVTFCGLL